jgi:DNA-binding response OmpR family regulator
MTDLKLLYVEDEPDIMEVATLSLELDPGIEVRTAYSGHAAFTLLDKDDWRPDVLLLDVMMPDMDGPTVLSMIRRRPDMATTPVIFCTARAQNEDRIRLLSLGAIGVITKPFDPLSLAQDVRALLRDA